MTLSTIPAPHLPPQAYAHVVGRTVIEMVNHDPANATDFWFENSRTSHGGPTTVLAEAEPSAEGWFRWDGCSHLAVGNDSAPWHHDEFADLDRLHAVLTHLRTISRERTGEAHNGPVTS